ncbi:MAG: molecular chaperone DnaJ [Candidatus Omnitrophica bacterium]|nr:molecular chaperone DnaJ [Candidatus Omnitrophota bacterium]
MTTKRDYYEILGISKTAGADEIKKAYRNLALKYHPDRVQADKKKEAEEKFKEMSEAYEILMDPQKKAVYDQYGHAGVDQSFRPGGFDMRQDFHHFDDLKDIFGGFDISELLRGFGFGEDIFGGSYETAGTRRSGTGRGRDLEYEIEINFEDAASGAARTIAVPRSEACGGCGGTGAKSGSKVERCPACGGRGKVAQSSGFFNIVRTCDRCGGEGAIIKTPCPACGGRGRVKVKEKLEVKIPAGVDSGSRIRLQGKGEAGSRGGRAGDLYLLIHVKPHEIFERHESDIYCEVPVSFATAVLGGEVEVPTLEGKITMKIPAGTQGGRTFRLRGKGIAHLHDYGKGDELVRVQIDVPTELSSEQKRALKEYAKVSGDDGKGPLSRLFVEKMRRLFR